MFRIGEFSKIAQVATSQLRYYGEIGLFMPISSDPETGYRYYSAQQLPQLNRILALKDLGLSLEQIKQLVEDEVSADEIRGMLTLRKAQIEQTLQAEALRLQAVESRLQHLEKIGKVPDEEVLLKSLPARPFLALRHQCNSPPETFALVQNINQFVSRQLQAKALGRFTVILHSEHYEPTNLDLELGFMLNQELDTSIVLPNGLKMTVRQLPPVATAITTMRFGGPEKGVSCYGAIGTWAETHKYQLVGPGREVFLVPPQLGRESEMVAEIQYPVTVCPC